MYEPPRRSWFGRNWIWIVPVGILTPVICCASPFILIPTLVFGAIKSSDVYTEALAIAQGDDRAKSELGEPIKAGFWVNGNIQVNGAMGNANLAIPISGPKKSATLYVVATKTDGKWNYSKLEIQPEGGERIDLRSKPER